MENNVFNTKFQNYDLIFKIFLFKKSQTPILALEFRFRFIKNFDLKLIS